MPHRYEQYVHDARVDSGTKDRVDTALEIVLASEGLAYIDIHRKDVKGFYRWYPYEPVPDPMESAIEFHTIAIEDKVHICNPGCWLWDPPETEEKGPDFAFSA